MLINELIQSSCMPHRLHAMLHVVHGAARVSRVQGRPGNVGRHRPALGRPAARHPGARAEISTPNGRVPHSFRGQAGLPAGLYPGTACKLCGKQCGGTDGRPPGQEPPGRASGNSHKRRGISHTGRWCALPGVPRNGLKYPILPVCNGK